LYRERGKVHPLEECEVIDQRGVLGLGQSILSRSAQVSQRTRKAGGMDSLGLQRNESEACRRLSRAWSTQWVATLDTEVWQLANLSGVEVTTTKCVSGQLAKEKIELNDESRIQRMLCKSARAEVLQMKARIEKESAEMETATEPATGSPAHGACNDHVPDQLELPRLESNEVLGLRVALAALEESTQRHESHLTKV
jgi:hypothetical protein